MFAVAEWPGEGDEPDDLDGLSAVALEAAFREADRARRRAEARLAAIAGVVERRQVYRLDGHATAAGWLRAVGRWSPEEAADTVRLGRLIAAAPVVADELADGGLGVAQAHVLARAGANPRCGDELGDVVPVLVEQAAKLAFVDFKVVVQRWVQLADVDGAHRAAEASFERRRAWLTVDGEGVHLEAVGPAAAGVAMDEILERFCVAEWHADWDAARRRHGDAATPGDLERTGAQRRFDALRAIFVRAAATPPDHVDPEPLVNLLFDDTTLADVLDPGSRADLDPTQRRCESANGTLLSPGEVLAAAVVGHVRRVVVNSAGVVIDLGRKRRLFTGGARDAVFLQSQRCIWPGCLVDAGRCQADHQTEWRHDGPTRADNGGPLCGRHNRWKSTHGYRTYRDADGSWHVLRPDGTEIT